MSSCEMSALIVKSRPGLLSGIDRKQVITKL